MRDSISFTGIMFTAYVLIPIWAYVVMRAAAKGALVSLAEFYNETEDLDESQEEQEGPKV